MKSGTDAVGLGHNLILTDSTVEATMTLIEAVPGHTTVTADTNTGVFPGPHAEMPIHITLTMTPQIRDHLHTEALQHTLETAAACNLDQHINQPRRPHTKTHHDPGHPKIHTLGETEESQ